MTRMQSTVFFDFALGIHSREIKGPKRSPVRLTFCARLSTSILLMADKFLKFGAFHVAYCGREYTEKVIRDRDMFFCPLVLTRCVYVYQQKWFNQKDVDTYSSYGCQVVEETEFEASPPVQRDTLLVVDGYVPNKCLLERLLNDGITTFIALGSAMDVCKFVNNVRTHAHVDFKYSDDFVKLYVVSKNKTTT